MTINVANLDITTDTFGTWVSKTNTLAHLTTNHVVTVDGTATGNNSTGNGTVNGVFGSTTLFANTALRGGNVSTACTLTISSNLSITNTATISGAVTHSNTVTTTGLTTLNGGMNTTTANASSAVNVGANTTVNTSTIKVGNSTVNTVITSTGIDTDGTLAVLNTVSFSNTLTVTGLTALNGDVNTTTANASVALNVGANVTVNTTSFEVGNSTVNTVITSTSFTTGNSTVNTVITSTGIDTDGTLAVLNSASFSNTVTVTGLTALNGNVNTPTANATTSVNVGANVTVNTSSIKIGNATVNAIVNSSTITIGNTTANGSDLYANNARFGALILDGTFTTTGTVIANADIIPPTTNAYSIGNSISSFNTGYFSNVQATNINATNSASVSTAFVANTTRVTIGSGIGLSANGSQGTSGQVLTSNGTSPYWETPFVGVSSVATGNGITGGTITSTGTLSVVANSGLVSNTTGVHVRANNGIVANATGTFVNANTALVSNSTGVHVLANNGIAANSTGLFVTTVNGLVTNSTGVHVLANTGIVANSTGTFVNAAYIATISANNAAYFDGQLPSYYTNATNITSGTLPNARLSSAIVNTSGSFTYSGVQTYNANIVLGSSGLSSNGSFGTAGHVLHSNGTATYWATDDQGVTSVASGNGITGGTITSTGTLSVVANSGLIANTTGIHILSNSGIIANSTGTFVNANNGIIANSLGVFIRPGNGTTLDTNGIQVLANSGLTSNATGVYVLANNGLVSNSTGVFVNANTGIVANSTGTFVNASYIATISANNATYLNGQLASFYTDIPSRLGYTPVQQGGGTGQAANKLYIGWTAGGQLALQVDSTNFGTTWPLTANNATNLNGQAASYYLNASNINTGTLPTGRLSGTYTMNITGTASGNYNAVQNLDAFTNGNMGAGSYLSNSYIQSSGQTVQLVRVYTYFTPAPAPVGVGCFPSYSIVAMADGSIKTIDSVLVGDRVLGGYGQINTVIAYHKVKLGKQPLYNINNRHKTTQEHRHWTTSGWTAIDTASAAPEYVHQIYIDNNGTTEMRKNVKLKYSTVLPLESGMTLVTGSGAEVINSIDADYNADPEQFVYTLICDGSHTCLVNDVVVSAWARDDDFDYDTWTPRAA